jgi:hypothetical protein
MLIWLGKQYLGQTDNPDPKKPDEEIDRNELANMLCSTPKDLTLLHRAQMGESSDPPD